MLKWIRFQIAWWKWLFNSPSVFELLQNGTDKESRDIIFERWFESEPKCR